MYGAKLTEDIEPNHDWNPDFGWQLLRRSLTYQKAVSLFIKAATQAKDSQTLKFFEFLNSEDLRTVEVDPISAEMLRSKRRDQVQERVPVDQHNFTNSEIYRNQNTENILHFNLGGTNFNIDPTSAHMQEFLKKFGDIIRFPIDPKVEAPSPHYLSELWNLRPASIVDSLHMASVKAERIKWEYQKPGSYFEGKEFLRDTPNDSSLFRVLHLNLELNTNFTDKAIVDTVASELTRLLKSLRESRPEFNIRISGHAFSDKLIDEKYFEAFDLHEIKALGYEDVGKTLFPKDSEELLEQILKRYEKRHKKRDAAKTQEQIEDIYDLTPAEDILEAQTEMARTRVERIQDLIKFFERR